MSRRIQVSAKSFEYLVVPRDAANDETMVAPNLRLNLELKMNAPEAAAAAAMPRQLSIPDATSGFAMRGKVAANMDTKRTKPEQDAIRDLEIDLIRTFIDDIPGHADLIAALSEMIAVAPDITPHFTETMRGFMGQVHDFQSLIELASLPNAPERMVQQIQELGAAIAESIKTLGQMTPLPPALTAQTQALFTKASETFALPLLATLMPMAADMPMSSKNNLAPQAPALHQQLHAVLAQVVAATGGKMTRDVTHANMALALMSESTLPSRTAFDAVLSAVQTVPPSARTALYQQMAGVEATITQIRSDLWGVPPSTVRIMDHLADTLSRMGDIMVNQAAFMSTSPNDNIAVIDRGIAALDQTGPITPGLIDDIRQMAAVLPEIAPTLMQPVVPAPGFVNTENVSQITAVLAQVATQLETGATQDLSLAGTGLVAAPTMPAQDTIDSRTVERDYIALGHPLSSPEPSSGPGPVVRDNVLVAPIPYPIGGGGVDGPITHTQAPSPAPTPPLDSPIIGGGGVGGGGERFPPRQDFLYTPPAGPPEAFIPPPNPSETPRVSEAFKRVCPKTGKEDCPCPPTDQAIPLEIKERINFERAEQEKLDKELGDKKPKIAAYDVAIKKPGEKPKKTETTSEQDLTKTFEEHVHDDKCGHLAGKKMVSEAQAAKVTKKSLKDRRAKKKEMAPEV
jgi:hypothetical protein